MRCTEKMEQVIKREKSKKGKLWRLNLSTDRRKHQNNKWNNSNCEKEGRKEYVRKIFLRTFMSNEHDILRITGTNK